MVNILNFVKRYQNWILAVGSAGLLFCSFPNVNFFPFAWFALVPLLVALKRASSWKSAFWSGYLTGGLFFAGLLLAIARLYPYANIFVTLLGYLLLVGYTALYFAIFSVIVYRLREQQSGILFALVAASVWVGLEWVRSWLLTGFPWGNIGYSQWNNPPAIQIASLTGVYGVSFVIVFLNAGIATLICKGREWRKEWVAVAVPLLLTIICLSYGFIALRRVQPVSEKHLKVALIPGNIPQIEKWQQASFPGIFRRYLTLTRAAALEQPDVIVWPETTVRGEILSGKYPEYHKAFKKMLQDINLPMLLGATDPDAFGDIYNRVLSVSPQGEILDKYAKMHLVPFGEYVPLASFLPSFVQFKPFEHGKTVNLLPIANVETVESGIEKIEVGTSICFESAFPNHFRQFVKKGAAAMGILTNDAWFEGSAFPELHLAMAPLRAVENRITVFRCANGGFSCVIDRGGRIATAAVTPDTETEFLIARVPLSDGNRTLYTRYGDWFSILCTLLSIAWIGGGIVGQRTGNVFRVRPETETEEE